MRTRFPPSLCTGLVLVLVTLAVLGNGRVETADNPGLAPPIDRPALMREHPERKALMAVAQAGKRLVAVGEGGIVILSEDQGRSWQQVQVPVSVTLTDVAFVGSKRGWIVGHGGLVLGTRDGGKSWERLIDGREVADMALRDVRSRVAEAGEDVPFELEIEKMRAEADAEGLPKNPLFSVYFTDERSGLVVGAFGTILRTEDGGESWSLGRSTIDSDSHLYAVREIDGRIFVVGERGGFHRSKPGIETFQTLDPSYEGTYFGIAPLSTKGGFLAFGLNGHGARGIQNDDGIRWKGFSRMNGTSLTNGAVLPDGRLALTAVDGTLRLSDDGGDSFEVIETQPPAPLNDLLPMSDGKILAVGMAGVTLVDAGAAK